MIQRRWARLCWLAAAMAVASPSEAGVWGTQPVLGVAGDYSTNPALLNLPNTAETHAALLLDAPIRYDGDALKVSILPSFRLSDSQGYSSLDSDYQHLNVKGEFDTDRSVYTLGSGVSRDSSLYHDYLLNGSTGVRRDMATVDLNWERKLTERSDIDTDVTSMRVRYDESAGVSTLTDYKYTSVTPALSWLESERAKLTAAAAVARYDSLDGKTQSTSINAQLGFIDQLTEIWSLSASAGYSRANNQLDAEEAVLEFTPRGAVIVFIPVTVKSTQNGSIYSVNLSRQTETLLLAAVASRQLTPTGFAFLSRQDAYQVRATYNHSERWSFSGDVHRVSYQQPQSNGASLDLNILYLQLTATWQWTEHWTVSMSATRVLEHYVSPSVDVGSSGVSIALSRQFNWKSLQ